VNDFIELESHEKIEDDSDKLRNEASDPPVVQYVNSLVIQATRSGSSDIHLKPKQDKVELKFRIDGCLYSMEAPPKTMFAAIVTRIKILSGLDIAERRLPQDGRFKIKLDIGDADIRVSCFPTIYGESVVMRILQTSSPLLGLDKLGFNGEDLKSYRRIIRYSYGLILVTGPTGSGKTTTLYNSLNEIKSSEKNIITLEDPVEYRLPFIQQTQVKPLIGFDFASGLRSILRQDPDVIMVGEIRDKETAEIAIHAALTGHLVFSTLHTNDAAGAVVRLVDMGIEPFLITSSLLGVVAQRLIRNICPYCRKEDNVSRELLEKLDLKDSDIKYFKGSGCPKCMSSGYRGRISIFELLISDNSVKESILKKSSSEEISRHARLKGMKTLHESGIEKLKEGVTTVEEILRVTRNTFEE
jgi:type II secretory ATPase GspE/PulE/Tfp pilus assembly ATPase PilB-like protein